MSEAVETFVLDPTPARIDVTPLLRIIVPVVLLATLPCPDDIAPIVPVGETRSCKASITRIGLSAFVTMTRTNSSVVTSAIVSLGSFVTPALTNKISNIRPDSRARSAAI